MIDTPADTPWIWLGLTLATAVMLGVVLGVGPVAPDAQRAATSIENVATSEYPGAATVPLRATSVRLAPDRIGLRGPGGQAHATIRYGPVTPVQPNSALDRVLDGHHPERVFGRPGAYRAALEAAQERTPSWERAGEELRVRQVQYGEVNSVLVGA